MIRPLLTAALLLPVCLSAQTTNMYTPLETGSYVPAQVYENPLVTTKKAIREEKELSRRDARIFHSDVTYSIWGILNSGKVYFDGPITEYLQSVLDKVLVDKPGLKDELKIYAYKSSAANAITYPDGHIFVYLGLLNVINSEDELAFILAHEVVHYAKAHAKSTMLRGITVSSAERGTYNSSASRYRFLRYSRENEQEADASGLNLIIGNSKYNALKATGALEKLDKDDDFGYTPDFMTIFNNSIFTLDTVWISEENLENFRKGSKSNNKDYFSGDDDEDDDYYEDDEEDEDDTHPDIEKRVLAMKEILKANDYKEKSTTENQSKFDEIKDISRHETVHNLYITDNFSLSFYFALKYMAKDTTDPFFKVYIMKSLYMMAYLESVEQLEKALKDFRRAADTGVAKTHAMLYKMGLSDLKKMGYGYMKANSETLKGIEEFDIYQALMTDTYLGKEAAQAYYKQYKEKYPNGRYINLVTTKLNSIF